MNKKPAGPRVLSYDLLRVVLIILIINLHVGLITTGWPHNVLESYVWCAVPLFMVLSFFLTSKYFLADKLPLGYLTARLARVVPSFIVWSLAGFAVHPKLFTAKNLALQLATGQVVNLPLYFVVLLIWFTILFWMLTYVPRRGRVYVYVALVVAAFFFEYSLMNYHFFNPLREAIKKSYGRFVELMPYAVLGLFLGLFVRNSKKYLLTLVFFAVSALSYSWTITLWRPAGFRYTGIALFAATAAIFSLILLTAGLKAPKSVSYSIHILGRYSFGVYLMHFVLLEFLLKSVGSLQSIITTYPIAFLAAYVVLCYSLCIAVGMLTRGKISYLLE